MENLSCCSCLAHDLNGPLRDFHRGKDPHPGHGLLLEYVGTIPTVFGNEKI
ncbi:hypothetical protein [Pseudomonas pergaminensis]|uniref:Uncharacterized protein n=1 Tax=Pseudomonas pergaminensis TaxID=2853159 RepID=A0ABW8R7N4_9PSED|nr:hypothetical protein [Pseudomonas sp.]